MEAVFDKFTGINNVQDVHRLKNSELSKALNVEIDDTNAIISRRGKVLRVSGVTHSVFSTGSFWLYRQGDELRKLNKDFTSQVLMAGFGTKTLTYVQVAHLTYFSDGATTWRLDETITKAGIDEPTLQATASSIGAGVLPTANYQHALTFISADGRESPARVAGDIRATGGIRFTGIPSSTDSQVVAKRIYLSEANGSDLRLAMQLANSTTTADFTGGTLGIALDTQHCLPTPAGVALVEHNGRLLVAQGQFAYFSKIYRHHLFGAEDFIALPDVVTCFASLTDGIWIATEKEIGWISGDVDGQYIQRAEFGGLRGTVATNDERTQAFITTQRGIVSLGLGGQFSNVTSKTYHPRGKRGAAAFFSHNFKQYYCNLN